MKTTFIGRDLNVSLAMSMHFNLVLRFSCDFCRYWLSVGAQPSEPVQRLLFRAGLLPPPPMVAMGRKGGLRNTRPVDPLSGRILTPKVPADPDQENKSKSNENDGQDSALTS